MLSYSNGTPFVKSLGNTLYTPLSITLKLIISPTGLPSSICSNESAVTTLMTSNFATLSGKPLPPPIFAVIVAGVAVEVGSKSTTLTLGGFSIEYPLPLFAIVIDVICPSLLRFTLPTVQPEPGVVPSPT